MRASINRILSGDTCYRDRILFTILSRDFVAIAFIVHLIKTEVFLAVGDHLLTGIPYCNNTFDIQIIRKIKQSRNVVP
jgi:hypothetical protein